jgi:putative heme transporter
MLGGVIVVQQIEAHVLQPFLMGRFVSLHPLGVIVAIAAGVIVAGIAGALIAVPLAAALNSVVQHLAAEVEPDSGPPGAAAVPHEDPEDTEMPEEPDLAGAAEALVDPGSADPSPGE